MKMITKIKQLREHSGQSLVELAIILPLLLLMLAGMVEVAFGMFAYLTALDLTREAARFASVRDYTVLEPGGELHPSDFVTDPSSACLDDPLLHYYYDSACFFTDPKLNPFLEFNAAKYDDLVITVFTVSYDPDDPNCSRGCVTPTGRHPSANGWSLYNDNWQRDCQGNVVNTIPFFSNEYLRDQFVAGAPTDRGIVVVEAYVCYDMIMNLPFISNFIPSPFRIHAYTVMPAPDAIPTPTTIPP
jgi:hypothetical protein